MLNLKTIRKNAGYKSQAELAKTLGIPTTTYASYEQNKASPNNTMLIKLANLLGVSLDYLLGHETENVMHLDCLTEQQKKAFDLMMKLDYDQTNILIGRMLEMLNLPYD